jgi:hypothetical protein
VWLSLRAVLIADARDDVIAGARDDFRQTEGVPPEFVDCSLPELRRALDPRSLEWLGAIRAEFGEPRQVPQLTGAAGGLG